MFMEWEITPNDKLTGLIKLGQKFQIFVLTINQEELRMLAIMFLLPKVAVST